MPKGIMHPNQLKYIKAPTYEQIMQVVNAYGVSPGRFEEFFGIFRGCVKSLKPGHVSHLTQLPTKHWHIIFESLKKIEAGEPLSLTNEPGTNGLAPKNDRKPHRKYKPSIKKTDLIKDLL